MIQYRIDETGHAQQGMNVTMLLQKARRLGGGPIPNLFLSDLNITPVLPDQTCKLSFGVNRAAIAYGLITCAAVVIASPEGIILHHAGSGSIPRGRVREFLDSLGNTNRQEVVGVYAVPKEWDDNYRRDAQQLVTEGIPDNNVIFIEGVGGNFGINQMGQVGIPC